MLTQSRSFLPVLSLSLIAGSMLTGCGAGNLATATSVAPAAVAGSPLRGSAHGGQQPVVGATMQLYAASTSGYGLASAPLIAAGNVTNASGNFNISGSYTCPSASTQVYLTATGGNPGLSQANPNLVMMAALGPCGTLVTNAATTFIQMNEITTIGGAYALSGFMTSANKVSSSAANASGLALAFGDVNQLVNNSTGLASGPSLPAGATLPVAEINTLANIIASCINTIGGTAGDNSNCGKLFTAATPPGGTAPTDTLTAALNIAQNPGNNVAALFALSSANPPFGGALATAPNDWTMSVNYATGSFSTPTSLAIDAAGNVWITNSASNTVTELSHSGAVVAGSPFTSAATAPSAIAIDAAGGPWIAGKGSNTLVHLTSAGAASATAANGGLNAPASVSIDMNGNVWAANSGANVVSEFTSTGTAVSATGFAGSASSKPVAVVISGR